MWRLANATHDRGLEHYPFNDMGLVGSVGRTVPGSSVALRDESGRQLPPGAGGDIRVRANLPERSSEAFPGPAGDAQGLSGALLPAISILHAPGNLTSPRSSRRSRDAVHGAILGRARQAGIKPFLEARPADRPADRPAAFSSWSGERLDLYPGLK